MTTPQSKLAFSQVGINSFNFLGGINNSGEMILQAEKFGMTILQVENWGDDFSGDLDTFMGRPVA